MNSKLGQIQDDDELSLAPAHVQKSFSFSNRKKPNPRSEEAKDSLRTEFLQELDLSIHVNVSDWEANFISSNLSRTSFTPAQRKIIDRMKSKYELKL